MHAQLFMGVVTISYIYLPGLLQVANLDQQLSLDRKPQVLWYFTCR